MPCLILAAAAAAGTGTGMRMLRVGRRFDGYSTESSAETGTRTLLAFLRVKYGPVVLKKGKMET